VVDVSDRLRAAREQAGFTIEEISARTKIKVVLLKAIERGEFEQLPGAFFARAFLRTYARELRLPPDEIVAAYDTQFTSSVGQDPTAGVPAPGHGTGEPPPAPRRFRLQATTSVWPVAAFAAAILVVLSMLDRPAPARSTAPQAVGTIGTADAARAPAPPASDPSIPETLRIEIRPSRAVWVTGSADGERVLYRILQAGERVSVAAKTDLRFRVGDAGAFEYSLNGAAGKPVGRPGEVREFRITRENLSSFRP